MHPFRPRPLSSLLCLAWTGGLALSPFSLVLLLPLPLLTCRPLTPALSGPSITRISSSSVFLPESPLWPKENLDPVVVQEGAPLTLQCNPPPGLPSPVIFWMSSCKSWGLVFYGHVNLRE